MQKLKHNNIKNKYQRLIIPYQQQPVTQKGQQQWQADQHPSAPSNLPTASSTDPVSLANPSPPPYSTAAASEPLMKKGSYKS
jgi:hypothetical protein